MIGGACCSPAYRWLTPRGTLLLAIGVPAAVLLRGVMTFAFFSGDAYIPLLLQTWRGTPATLTGIVFTVTTLSPGPPARGSRRGASTATGRAASSRSGSR